MPQMHSADIVVQCSRKNEMTRMWRMCIYVLPSYCVLQAGLTGLVSEWETCSCQIQCLSATFWMDSCLMDILLIVVYLLVESMLCREAAINTLYHIQYLMVCLLIVLVPYNYWLEHQCYNVTIDSQVNNSHKWRLVIDHVLYLLL